MSFLDQYSCEEVFRRLDDYLDRELTEMEREFVHAHLDLCAACAAEHHFQQSVLREMRARLQRVSAPADLLAKVAQRLDSACAEPDRSEA